MRAENLRRHPRASGISIRWKLVVYMTLFVAIILLVTWLFQIVLLDAFFRAVKKNEMREAADALAVKVASDDLQTAAYGEAIDHSLCVTIFRIAENGSERMVNIDATGSNFTVTLSPEHLGKLYNKALENEGTYFSRIAFGGFEVSDGSISFDNLPFSDERGTEKKIPTKNMRMVYVKLVQGTDDSTYMILLDASLQPLDSTVRTLGTQFLWIAGIILIAALIMVFLLYRKISSPIIRMNESAKQLARGNYDAVFSGKGYRETRELADTLNYASHELSRLDRLQKELIANISHDLRTPLTMIKGYGEVMRDLPGENTPENMQVIIDETTRLSELVNDLLDLSKLQSGARAPEFSLFDLTDAVHEVMKRYDTLIKHRGYHVSFDFDREAYVAADRGMLLQVLYNLINNAVNYTGEDKTVTIKQTVFNSRVRISVSDTGKGIEPEEMPLIWDRYYKVDKVHKRATVGTGLGLSIVKGILELHHAAYGVNSTIGKGSIFWFELPLTEAPVCLPDQSTAEE
ncbi:MAG: HAMP domain-containing histidine kinase [Clostridia bacterium]|nr:HAMP domain-containing histidine kinase [Clostridia bacterium]